MTWKEYKKKREEEDSFSIVNSQNVQADSSNDTYQRRIEQKPSKEISQADTDRETVWSKILTGLQDAGRIGENTALGADTGIKNLANYMYASAESSRQRAMGTTIQDNLRKVQNSKDLTEQEKKFYLASNMYKSSNKDILPDNIKQALLKNPLDDAIAGNEQKIQENISNQSNEVTKKIAELAPSVGNMGVGMAASAINPYLGGTYFGLSAAGSYMNDAKARGMSEEKAIAYGAIMGALEGITEEIGVGNIQKGGKAVKALVTGAGKETLKTATKETAKAGIKETLKDFGIGIADNFVQESIMEPLQELTAQAVGGEDKANWENMGQRMLQSGIDGALTSIIMSGANAGANTCISLVEKIQNGETISQTEVQQAVKDAEKSGIDIQKETEDSMTYWMNKAQDIINQNSGNKDVEQQTEMAQNGTSQEQNLNNASKYEYKQSDNSKIDTFRKDVSKYWNNSEKTSNLVNTIEKVIEDKGYNVRLDENIGDNINGKIFTNANGETEIRINPKSERAGEFILTHEITHSIATNEMKSLIEQRMNKDTELRKAVEDLKKIYNTNDINEEVLADISGQVLGNQEFINNLSTEKPNIFKRIYDKIISIANRITGNSNEALFIRDLKNKWEQAYRQSNNNIQGEKYSIGGKTGVDNAIKQNPQYSAVNYAYNQAQKMAQQNIDNEAIRQKTNWFQDKNGDWKFEFSDKDMSLKNMKLEEGKTYKLGDILEHDTLFTLYPELRDYDVLVKDMNVSGSFDNDNKTILINKNRLKSKMQKEGTLIHEIQHAIQHIERFETGKGSRVSKLAYYNSLGEIEADNTKQRFLQEQQGTLNRSKIAPESSKGNPKHRNLDSYLENRTIIDKMKDGLYNYLKDKVKGNNVNEDFENYQTEDTQENFNNKTLVDGRRNLENENSEKGSFSLDNKGRKLSKEQQEYFKDSKVRDENGNLKTLYHGTGAEFTVFDYKYLGKNGTSLGKGFYLTDDINTAKGYSERENGHVMEVYANIEKPLSYGKTTISSNEYIEFIEAINRATDGQLLGDYSDGEKIKKGNSQYEEMLEQFREDYKYGGDDIDLISEILNSANLSLKNGYKILKDTLGYDGIISNKGFLTEEGTVYVPFLSEQIKNVDNINPTSNEDIRYSKQNNNWQKYLESKYPQKGTTTNLKDIKQIAPVKQGNKNIQPAYVGENVKTNNQATKGENINWNEIERPKENRKYRKHYQSIIESSNTTAEAKKIAKELMGIDTYIPDSNKNQLQRADNYIMENGVEAALNRLIDHVNTNDVSYDRLFKKVGVDDIALGERLMQYFSKTGDAEQLLLSMQATAEAGSDAGRAVQALSMLNHQTPQGQLTWLNRTIDKMNKKIVEKKSGTIVKDENGRIEKIINNQGKDITDKVALFELTPDMANKIMQSEDQNQMYKNLNEVYEELGQQVPKSMIEKLDSWRYFSMLANIRTHTRNIIGNIAMGKTQRIKDKLAGGIEDVVSKFNPKMERTKTLKFADEKTKEFAKNDLKNIDVQSRLELNENKYNPQSRIQNAQRTFKSDLLENTLGKLFNINDKSLAAEDGWGLKGMYWKSLSDYITANNIDVDKITDSQLAKARNYAVEQAKIATFHQANKLASLINQLDNVKGGKFIRGALSPFVKTPLNVAKAGLEYNPTGLVKTIIYDSVQLKKGNISANQYIDNLSKGLTGTGLSLLGFVLADLGIIKASGDEDKDKENFDENQGNQKYSMTIAGKNISLDWVSPVGIPLFVGAEIHKLFNQSKIEKSTEKSTEDETLMKKAVQSGANLLNAMATSMNPMTEMSMISSLTNALSAYNKDTAFGELGANMTKSYINQYIPTVLKQIAKTTDKYERSTKSTKTGIFEKNADQLLNQIKSGIPGLRQTLPVKTDIWGADIEQEGNLPLRAFNNFINPATVKDVSTDEVDKELNKLYEVNNNSSILPDTLQKTMTIDNQKYRLTNKEYAEYTKEYGQTSYKLINDLIKSSSYKNLTDAQKEETISNIYSYAKEKNKLDYADKVGVEFKTSTLYNTLEDLNKNGGKQSDYLSYLSQTKGMEKEKDKNNVLANSNYSNKTKEIIYKNGTGKDDKLYNMLEKSNISITQYLKYKVKQSSGEFESNKDEDGNSISGSSKEKYYEYVNKNISGYGNRLLILGNKYKLSDSERNSLVEYINKIAKTNTEKLEMYKQLSSNFKVKDGKVYYK